MNYYYFIGVLISFLVLIMNIYFGFKFKQDKIFSLKEINEIKKETGKKPSYWKQYRFAFNILSGVVAFICFITFFLAVFGIIPNFSDGILT